jgi:hypothetical chaperone protein
MGYKIGLDFGTSNSGAAILENGEVRLLPLDPANNFPEVVKTILYITRNGDQFIGQEAVQLYYRHNVNRLRRYVNKRVGEIEYVGAEMSYMRDVFATVDELSPGRLLQYLKTALRKDSELMAYHGTQIFDRYYSVSDLIEVFLRTLKLRAENELGGKIEEVVLGRPVKFSEKIDLDEQAEETLLKAALGAGFSKVSFELEPVAAAIYYEKSIKRPENVLVFDFGGGTLDIAVMHLGGVGHRVVLASDGIDIAGSDFDRAIIKKRLLMYFGLEEARYHPEIFELILAVPEWMALPEHSSPLNRQRLENAIRSGVAPIRLKSLQTLIFNDLAFSFYNRVETAKIALSSQDVTVINPDEPGLALWELYTRFQFETDIAEYKQQIERVVLETLQTSGLKISEVDAVIKTGGSSNIPLFHYMLEKIFGNEIIKTTHAFNSVTAGLAISAAGGETPRA